MRIPTTCSLSGMSATLCTPVDHSETAPWYAPGRISNRQCKRISHQEPHYRSLVRPCQERLKRLYIGSVGSVFVISGSRLSKYRERPRPWRPFAVPRVAPGGQRIGNNEGREVDYGDAWCREFNMHESFPLCSVDGCCDVKQRIL